MERFLTFKIKKEYSSYTVGRFLKEQVNLTKRQISQIKFRSNGITKNGVRCRVTEHLSTDDILRICLEERDTASSHIENFSTISADFITKDPLYTDLSHSRFQQPTLEILYEDEDLLAVNKPAGMVTHPTGVHYTDSLTNLVADYFQKKGQSICLRPIGRLDKETSGIVIFAKNQTVASRLQDPSSPWHLQKQYLAVVSGMLPVDPPVENSMQKVKSLWHTIDTPLIQDPDHPLKMCISRTPNNLQAKCAVTHYHTLFSCSEWSLVMLRLDTGRTHQIRVHMASIGHPLLGDTLYNTKNKSPASLSFSRAALHAWKVTFQHPFSEKILSLKAPFPDDFSHKTWKSPKTQ